MSSATLEVSAQTETNSSEEAPVTITQAALRQVHYLKSKKGDDSLALRIGVKGGGCSGLSYVLGLEANSTEKDEVYNIEGLSVFIDRKSLSFIAGLNLDYTTKNLLEGGWQFTNPNAQKSCGCGTSFTPK